jgi:hypothetical protein
LVTSRDVTSNPVRVECSGRRAATLDFSTRISRYSPGVPWSAPAERYFGLRLRSGERDDVAVAEAHHRVQWRGVRRQEPGQAAPALPPRDLVGARDVTGSNPAVRRALPGQWSIHDD